MGRYSTPIQDLIDRLTYHATTGQTPARMLDGLKIVAIPEKDVEGSADLPNVRLFVPDFHEHFSGGRNVDGHILLKLHIATQREKGLPESMSWTEKIMNALQISTTTGQRTALAGTARHFDVEAKDGHATDRALNVYLMITLQPFKHEVGSR